LGCETAQGFFISKGLPVEKFAAWARRWESGEGADIVTLTSRSPRAHEARG